MLLLAACTSPTSGNYLVSTHALSQSPPCQDDWYIHPETLLGDGTAQVEIGKDTLTIEDITCSLEKDAFTCDTSTTIPVDDAEATLIYNYRGTGEFDTSTSFTSDWNIQLSCQGTECTALETCALTLILTGNLS